MNSIGSQFNLTATELAGVFRTIFDYLPTGGGGVGSRYRDAAAEAMAISPKGMQRTARPAHLVPASCHEVFKHYAPA